MASSRASQALPWLEPGDPFPPVASAWGEHDPAPGLLAAGGVLDVPTLLKAYGQGIFPWFSAGQPVLWWSTDPRTVLLPAEFRLHRSLRKTLKQLLAQDRLQIRVDHDFERVIRACAETPRDGQEGTWILPSMVQAYLRLHRAGAAHSIESWIDGELAGGLYCINLGQAVYGESMFSRRSDASKMALAALVAFCMDRRIGMIDCQQDTSHLRSLGARTISRRQFCQHLEQAIRAPTPIWQFEPVYWNHLLHPPRPSP